MKFHHVVEHAMIYKKQVNEKKGRGPHLLWWQLLLIGIGSIIGAGFFLGTGLSISMAGPAILIGYVIGGITAYFVFSALAEMSVYDPQEGSFRTYAKQAYGHFLGFTSGWNYWLAGVLIMSSEIIALSTFTRFWLPELPIWLLSVIYALLGIGIILMGVSDFEKIESLFASIKLGTLIIFIIFAFLFFFGVIHDPQASYNTANNKVFTDLFPYGFSGFWQAMIFIFFSFGGIAVMGVASSELKDKEQIPRTGKLMLSTLVAVYLLSLYSVLKIAPRSSVSAAQSPFVTALSSFNLPYIDSVFNLIIITAAFSTMVGALYSITSIMLSLSADRDAPKALAKKNKRGVPTRSLFLSGLGVAVSVVLSSILPSTIYQSVTTAAGIMLILNWIFILLSHLRLHKNFLKADLFKGHKYHMFGYPFSNYLGIFFILFTIAGAAVNKTSRYSLIATGVILFIIAVSYLIYALVNNKQQNNNEKGET